MRRRWLVVGVVVGSVVLPGLVFAMGWRGGPSLSADERSVVEEVENGSLAEQPAEAARYIEDSIALLLSPEVASQVAGADLAELFDSAFADDGEGHQLLDVVVAGVAAEGAIYSPELRQVLGAVVESNMAWFDARINAPFASRVGEASEEVRRQYVTAHDLLREMMRDGQVATRLRAAMTDFGRTEVAGAPDGGDERSHRLAEIGRVQAVFTIAQINAEMAKAREEGDVAGIEAVTAAGNGLGSDNAGDSAMWLALDALGSPDSAVRSAARAQAAGQPFLDTNGQVTRTPSPSETDALREWAKRQTMSGGVLEEDSAFIDAGAVDVRSTTIVPSLEDRL